MGEEMPGLRVYVTLARPLQMRMRAGLKQPTKREFILQPDEAKTAINRLEKNLNVKISKFSVSRSGMFFTLHSPSKKKTPDKGLVATSIRKVLPKIGLRVKKVDVKKTKIRQKKKPSSIKQSAKRLTLEEKLAQYLNEALSFENAAVSRLQSRIKEVQLEDVKQQLQQHLEVTREQQNRLKQLITNLGARPTNDSGQLPIFRAPKPLANTIEKSMTSTEQQIKSTKEDLVIENAEVTMYDTLLQVAQLMNAGDVVPILTQNLAEERAMADWIRANMPAIITQLYPEIQSSIVLPEGEEGREVMTEGAVTVALSEEAEE